METSIAFLFIAGAAGALAKDILEDNALTLPSFKDGKFYMGFLGGVIIGGLAGVCVDHSPIVAFTAGYTGSSVITNLILKQPKEDVKNPCTDSKVPA